MPEYSLDLLLETIRLESLDSECDYWNTLAEARQFCETFNPSMEEDHA